MPKCDVCCEVFTLQLRKKVECPYCDYNACSACHERYLLSSSERPHCMSCRKGWSREVLHENFTQKFLNKTYKEHRESVLFDRERSLMPETQPHVEAALIARKYEAELGLAAAQLRVLANEWQAMRAASLELMGKETWVEALIERDRRCMEIVNRQDIITRRINHLQFAIHTYKNTTDLGHEKRKFVRACPVNGCKGFLSTAWKCGLCETYACSKCHDVKKDDHVCDPNALATAELLNRDSKNCPKCASLIFKINGCDQMYCTQCHTAFSWRSGRVENGSIHNPHYYEYMRQHGSLPRAAGDVVCGGLPHIQQIDTARHRVTYSLKDRSDIMQIHRMHGHIMHVVMNRYRTNNVADNRDLRILYMMNEMTEDNFKKKIQQREKAGEKKREILEVLDLYQTVVTDLMQKVANDPNHNYTNEFVAIREHVAGLLSKVANHWNCSVPRFINMWSIS